MRLLSQTPITSAVEHKLAHTIKPEDHQLTGNGCAKLDVRR